MSDLERRHYKRIPFIAEVLIRKGDQQWSCELEDISLKGLLVEAPAGVSADMGGNYQVELVLGEDVEIRMHAAISHSTNSHWGLEWSDIELDGITHLRRLLELNMGDPEEMNRELAELG